MKKKGDLKAVFKTIRFDKENAKLIRRAAKRGDPKKGRLSFSAFVRESAVAMARAVLDK